MNLLALPFLAVMLVAARPAPVPVAAPLPVAAPAEVAADPANRLILQLSNGGTVVIQLRPDAAPNHVQRVQTLVRQHFYDGTIFHRVIPGFMAQGGDPTGTGEGGSKLPDLKAEFNSLQHLRGTVAAARTADSTDTANSQFYIMLAPNSSLDGQYTVFGRVISGMEAVDQIAPGQPPANPTKIVRASLGDGTPAAAPAPQQQPESLQQENTPGG
jgi:cyclophilin family peptidyl-prolyl cis-trans isomerase